MARPVKKCSVVEDSNVKYEPELRSPRKKRPPVNEFKNETDEGCGLANCYALKVIFFDIAISLGDTATDFFQVLIRHGDDNRVQVFHVFHVQLSYIRPTAY